MTNVTVGARRPRSRPVAGAGGSRAATTSVSRSNPSAQIVPSSARTGRRRPAPSPSTAPSGPSGCARARTRARRRRAARSRSITRSARAPTSSGCSPPGQPSRPQVPARVRSRGSAAWSVPRTRRSPTRAGRRRSPRDRRTPRSRTSRGPAAAGSCSTSANSQPASSGLSAWRVRAPSRSSGRSVRLVCCPLQAPLGLAVADDDLHPDPRSRRRLSRRRRRRPRARSSRAPRCSSSTDSSPCSAS